MSELNYKNAGVDIEAGYKSVDMIFVTRKSLMVPNQIFDKTKLKDLVRANFEISDKEEIQFNKLKSISACNVFVIPSFITTLMVNTFPEINFYHGMKVSDAIRYSASLPNI